MQKNAQTTCPELFPVDQSADSNQQSLDFKPSTLPNRPDECKEQLKNPIYLLMCLRTKHQRKRNETVFVDMFKNTILYPILFFYPILSHSLDEFIKYMMWLVLV